MDCNKAGAGHRHHGEPAPNDPLSGAINQQHKEMRAAQQESATARRRLGSRRDCEHFNFQCAGVRYIASIGRFPDGAVGEVFIVSEKAGSAADTAARDAAIAASIALQHGADPDKLRDALCRDSHGKANGPLGAALDLIVRQGR
jgi:ribonucleoside-diphosphate reductase alpha chain